MQPDPGPKVKDAPPSAPVNSAAAQVADAILALLPSFRSGWRTSEFWITVLVTVFPFILALLDKLPAQWAAIISPIGTALYQLLRNRAKSAHHDAALEAMDIAAGAVSREQGAGSREPEPPTPAGPAAVPARQSIPITPDLAKALARMLPLPGQPAAPTVKLPQPAASNQQPAPSNGGNAAFITPGLCILAAALSAIVVLALAMLTGCTATERTALKTRVVKLARATGKEVIRLGEQAVVSYLEAQAGKLTHKLEGFAK